MGISNFDPGAQERKPWNAGSLVGAKRPLKPRDVRAIRFFLDKYRRMSVRFLSFCTKTYLLGYHNLTVVPMCCRVH